MRFSFSFFQSTSLSRGKTDIAGWYGGKRCLSIHFPLTREDTTLALQILPLQSFNPLPSHEGRQRKSGNDGVKHSFNPLPSHEGRRCKHDPSFFRRSFNPLPSHEGRPVRIEAREARYILSIHFPLTREDTFRFHGQSGF